MNIDSAEVVVCSPGRNFVTLVLRTDDGRVGLGDATVNGRELAAAAYLEHLLPTLVGRDAHAIEDMWQYLYRGAYWRRGPITMAAVAAVDVALWDLKAQAAGLPLYQLLGGRSRSSIRAYGHAHGRDVSALTDSVHALVEQGFTAVRIQVGIPGLAAGYGFASGPDPAGYEPAHAGNRPVEEFWDAGPYLRHMPSVFDAVRATFGRELDLLHDVHHRLTPNQAARLGRSLEEYEPFWLEDMTPAENPTAFRLIRQHTTVPLATGEIFNSIYDYQSLFTEQLIDYARSAVTHAGGLTAMRKILDFAALYQIKSAIHGPTDISPVGYAAGLHLNLALHNFGIQEYMQHAPVVSEVFSTDYRLVDGHFRLGERPGLGVTLDRRAAERYPYRSAYLPVNRLLDGTMHDW